MTKVLRRHAKCGIYCFGGHCARTDKTSWPQTFGRCLFRAVPMSHVCLLQILEMGENKMRRVGLILPPAYAHPSSRNAWDYST